MATLRDLAEWGRQTGVCFVCGQRLTRTRARTEGINPACLAELRARAEDDHR